MALLTAAIALLALMAPQGLARSVNRDEFSEPIVAVLSGTFHALDALSGQTQHRLNRRHLEAMDDSSVQAMRLHLGPEVAALDMELSQDSAWTDDSLVVVRRGEQVQEVQNAVDASCFLSGRLTSHAGAASINRCGKMTGLIQTEDYVYEIEEMENGNLDSSVKVTMKRSEGLTSSEDGLIVQEEEALGFEERNLDEDISKRQQRPIAAEVVVYMDANFVRWMSTYKGKTSNTSLTQWMVMKWNVIRNVYGNVQVVGIPFTIQLKKVEIWRSNPSYYARLGNSGKTSEYMRAICENTPTDDSYDHKMLYTQGTGGSAMGMAYLNGICRPTAKCSLVKGKSESVQFELHEFGHNLGFKHDPQMQPCNAPDNNGGFMGWKNTYRFLDCYKRKLLQTVRQERSACLLRQDVFNRTVMNA